MGNKKITAFVILSMIIAFAMGYRNAGGCNFETINPTSSYVESISGDCEWLNTLEDLSFLEGYLLTNE